MTLLSLLIKMKACEQEGDQIYFLQHFLKAHVLRYFCWMVVRITCWSKSLAKLVLEETQQLPSNHLCKTINSSVSNIYGILV